jgi:hypothetical protein
MDIDTEMHTDIVCRWRDTYRYRCRYAAGTGDQGVVSQSCHKTRGSVMLAKVVNIHVPRVQGIKFRVKGLELRA